MAVQRFPDWAIVFIADIGNGEPNVLVPDPLVVAFGWLVETPEAPFMNWLFKQAAYFIRGRNEFKVEGLAYEINVAEVIIVDNSSIPITMDLPDMNVTNPVLVSGQFCTVIPKELYSVNSVTLVGNGKFIGPDMETSIILDIDDGIFNFWWDEGLDYWQFNLEGVVGRDI